MPVDFKEGCNPETQELWREIYSKARDLESLHHKVVKIDNATHLGDHMSQLLLERTTCIQKHIATNMTSCNLNLILNDPHIADEIRAMMDDLEQFDWELQSSESERAKHADLRKKWCNKIFKDMTQLYCSCKEE